MPSVRTTQSSRSPIACSMYWELIPVTILIGVYLLIVFPILLWQVWGLKDAYGIRRDLLICDTVGIVCLAVAFIWEFGLHQVSSIWSCLFFVWVAMLLIHISSVVVPLIKAIGHSKRTKHQIRNRHSTASSSDSDSVHANDRGATKIRRSDFNRVLDDPYEYETFREFAASCFCSELTAFIDEYQSLKTKTVTALGNADSPILETSSSWRSSLSLDSPNGDFYGDVSVHPQQFAYNKTASKAKPLTLSTGISVSILETAKAAYPQHEFAENTQFPTTVLDRLVRIFSIYLNLNSYMALNVPSVMVRKIQDQLDRKQMSLPILDEVKDEVLFMLYTDVFTRYQRTR
ncbi:hypothetical protein DL89DRAFT_87753 [Linderina pennispora]|uniref:RGS domain-containing protein n=1 Tax=Linderina pennispora TaxID=61395 RepID=A0A1Y1WJ07_9FUNG|nr:uncharacterized protein DL89DRAFT_87753 [Linderina pennispora]ORX73084.1 hypothetical protein DL89DRAFT_87753 [Linderina pennispora]